VDANGCAITLTVAVTQSGGPVISVSPDVTILSGTSTTLSASGGGTYSWNTGDSTSSIVVTPSSNSFYLVTVTDTTGCSASDTVWVFLLEADPCTGTSVDEAFFIPNAFTPNEDQENDNICLQGITGCIEEFRIEIYSRWGEKVFESVNKNFCWDGTYNGEKMNAALFTYYIDVTLLTGNKKIMKGNISLMR
jgi:gliding motility-associated-like protein